MTRISVASLKLTNPKFKITVVLDEVSEKILRENSDPLLVEVDQIIKVSTPQGTNIFRNRHIKTRLGNLISGPFLFLDSDTIIRGDISAIYNCNAEIAAVPNLSQKSLKNQIWSQDLKELQRMGWDVRNDFYVNGGVLFFNNSKLTYNFFKSWHSKWLQLIKKSKYYRDQPSLNSAIFDKNIKLKILPDIYNAQFRGNPSVTKNALIWHYYSSASISEPVTSFEKLCLQIMTQKKDTLDGVEDIIHSSHPWRSEIIFDDVIAAYSKFRGNLSELEENWFSGNRILALGKLLRSILN